MSKDNVHRDPEIPVVFHATCKYEFKYVDENTPPFVRLSDDRTHVLITHWVLLDDYNNRRPVFEYYSCTTRFHDLEKFELEMDFNRENITKFEKVEYIHVLPTSMIESKISYSEIMHYQGAMVHMKCIRHDFALQALRQEQIEREEKAREEELEQSQAGDADAGAEEDESNESEVCSNKPNY